MKIVLTVIILSLMCFTNGSVAFGAASKLAQSHGGEQTEQKRTEVEEVRKANQRVLDFFAQKKYTEALAEALKAVQLAERLPAQDHLLLSGTLSNLAGIYMTKKEYGKVAPVYERMLALREQRQGPSEGFEVEAFVNFLCILVGGKRPQEQRDLILRVDHIFIEDSIILQGIPVPSDKKTLTIGQSIQKPYPKYPHELRMQRISGSAVFFIDVDEEGRVTNTRALSCSTNALKQAGVDAARRTTFKPTLVGEKPVKVIRVIYYHWILM